MQLVRRIARILTADAHAMFTALEDRQVLLKQHLREMEEALNCQEAALGLRMASREQLAAKQSILVDDMDVAHRDAELAVCKGRDDLARLAIRRRQLLLAQLETTTQTLEELDSTLDDERRKVRRRRVELEALQLQCREVLPEQQEQVDASGSLRRLEAAVEMELMQRKSRHPQQTLPPSTKEDATCGTPAA